MRTWTHWCMLFDIIITTVCIYFVNMHIDQIYYTVQLYIHRYEHLPSVSSSLVCIRIKLKQITMTSALYFRAFVGFKGVINLLDMCFH